MDVSLYLFFRNLFIFFSKISKCLFLRRQLYTFVIRNKHLYVIVQLNKVNNIIVPKSLQILTQSFFLLHIQNHLIVFMYEKISYVRMQITIIIDTAMYYKKNIWKNWKQSIFTWTFIENRLSRCSLIFSSRLWYYRQRVKWKETQNIWPGLDKLMFFFNWIKLKLMALQN